MRYTAVQRQGGREQSATEPQRQRWKELTGPPHEFKGRMPPFFPWAGGPGPHKGGGRKANDRDGQPSQPDRQGGER